MGLVRVSFDVSLFPQLRMGMGNELSEVGYLCSGDWVDKWLCF